MSLPPQNAIVCPQIGCEFEARKLDRHKELTKNKEQHNTELRLFNNFVKTIAL